MHCELAKRKRMREKKRQQQQQRWKRYSEYSIINVVHMVALLWIRWWDQAHRYNFCWHFPFFAIKLNKPNRMISARIQIYSKNYQNSGTSLHFCVNQRTFVVLCLSRCIFSALTIDWHAHCHWSSFTELSSKQNIYESNTHFMTC